MRSLRRRSNKEGGELTFSYDMKTKIKSDAGKSKEEIEEKLFGKVFSLKSCGGFCCYKEKKTSLQLTHYLYVYRLSQN